MPNRDYESELRAIMDFLAESVATAPDEVLLQEAKDRGENMEELTEKLRARLLEVVDTTLGNDCV